MIKTMSLSVALFLLFLTLKLTGVILWSWWYVTMPLWIGFVVVTLFMVFGVTILGVLGKLFQ